MKLTPKRKVFEISKAGRTRRDPAGGPQRWTRPLHLLRPQQQVQGRESTTDDDAEGAEDEELGGTDGALVGGGWSVRQGTKVSLVYGLYTSRPDFVSSRYIVIFRIKAESRPYGAGLAVSPPYTAAGLAVIALNLLAAVVGAVSWQRNVPSVAFWYLLAAQITTGFFVLFACVVHATGYRASDELHYLYDVPAGRGLPGRADLRRIRQPLGPSARGNRRPARSSASSSPD